MSLRFLFSSFTCVCVREWVSVCLCVCLNVCTCLCVVMCMSVRAYMSVSSSQTSFILLFICSQDESFIRESKTWVACPELCVKESRLSHGSLWHWGHCDTGYSAGHVTARRDDVRYWLLLASAVRDVNETTDRPILWDVQDRYSYTFPTDIVTCLYECEIR